MKEHDLSVHEVIFIMQIDNMRAETFSINVVYINSDIRKQVYNKSLNKSKIQTCVNIITDWDKQTHEHVKYVRIIKHLSSITFAMFFNTIQLKMWRRTPYNKQYSLFNMIFRCDFWKLSWLTKNNVFHSSLYQGWLFLTTCLSPILSQFFPLLSWTN